MPSLLWYEIELITDVKSFMRAAVGMFLVVFRAVINGRCRRDANADADADVIFIFIFILKVAAKTRADTLNVFTVKILTIAY